MRTIVSVAALCCVFLACTVASPSAVPPPDLEFVQLSGPADQNYTQGDIEVQYGLRIRNKAEVPITLRSIQVQTVGGGGAYRLRPNMYYFERAVQPLHHEDVTFWAKAISQGDAASNDISAPINVRVIAIFDSPSGGFRRVFAKMLPQR